MLFTSSLTCVIVVVVVVIVIFIVNDAMNVVIVFVVIFVVNRNCIYLLSPLSKLDAYYTTGFTSSVMAYPLSPLRFHFWKIFASFLYYSRYLKKEEKKRSVSAYGGIGEEKDTWRKYGHIFRFLLDQYSFQSSLYYYAD